MGAFPHAILGNSTEIKGMNTLQSKGTKASYKTKALGNKTQGGRSYKKLLMVKRRKSKRVSTKRSPRWAPRHRQSQDHGFATKVQTLKGMIPNHESDGLEGLFRDTADYIMVLQVRVRVMQMMVDALEDGYSTTSFHE